MFRPLRSKKMGGKVLAAHSAFTTGHRLITPFSAYPTGPETRLSRNDDEPGSPVVCGH
jgi:hypothetical protein